jgi:ubiquitin carboxyl-terminal hydrolase 5/13
VCWVVAARGGPDPRWQGNNADRAVDWLFNHPDEPAAPAPAAAASAAVPAVPAPAAPADPRPPRYRLVAAINHRGRNTQHGHYVAHVWMDGRWVLFNDQRVLETPRPDLGSAYMYFYRKVDDA